MKTEPVTREEWEARKLAAPPGLLALNETLTRRAEAERVEADARRAADLARLAERREAFEAALSDLLRSEGGEWLSEYRVPDEVWCGAHPFSLDHTFWQVVYDLRPVGHHRIRVELCAVSGARSWTPAALPFSAILPAGARSYPTLADAVRCAGHYVECPF